MIQSVENIPEQHLHEEVAGVGEEANMNLRLQHVHVFITCLASSRVKFDRGWTSHTMCGARLLGHQQGSVFIAREQKDKKDKSLLKVNYAD
jgi:hypothetical protein